MTRSHQRIIATVVLLVGSVFSGFQTVHSQTSKRLAWDEDSASSVTGFAVAVDGNRTDYALTPEQTDGTCGCSVPLPFSSGRHSVVVSAYNAAGESSTAPFIVGPTASAGGPYSAQAGTPLSVTGAGSTDGTGTITSYSWNWGDGTSNTFTNPTASHTYASAGNFTITLTVTDDFPASHTATTTAGIVVPPPPGTPTSANPANGATGVSTTSTLTWNASGATTYEVSFGASNPPPAASSNQASASYTPGALTDGTTYFWQIVARNSAGTTTGPVWSFTTAPASGSSVNDIVIYASDLQIGSWHGTWTQALDLTSPNGIKLLTPDLGLAVTTAPLAAPVHYVDVPFSAVPGTPYTLWLRVRAQGNSIWNDSVWVQFSDAQVDGASVYPLNSTSGLLINLAGDSTGASISGWGWRNSAYWLSQAATVTFGDSGSHTLRIQMREDGLQLDQIVLSPSTYLSMPPGPPANDTTIVPKDGTPASPASPNLSGGAARVDGTPTLTWSPAGASTYDVRLGTSNAPPLVATDQPSPSYTPAFELLPNMTYFWQIVARNSSGTTPGPVWSFTTAVAPMSRTDEIVIYASDLPAGSWHGAWAQAGDVTSPNATKLTTPDVGLSVTSAPLAAPAHYVDVSFNAVSGTPYTLWLRVRAQGNSKWNDSVWVQFSDARVDGAPAYPLNSTSGLLINLASDGTNAGINGWGWRNSAYWLSQPTTVTFARSGSHTLRIQLREDGLELDQIVLSPSRYLSEPPGPATNDSTLLPK